MSRRPVALRVVAASCEVAPETSGPRIEQTSDGRVTVHYTIVQAAPDELLPHPFGLEPATAMALSRSDKLRTIKLGRRVYCRRSDLLALVDAPAAERPERTAATPASPEEAYAGMVARARRGR